jgi:hypothetical protein
LHTNHAVIGVRVWTSRLTPALSALPTVTISNNYFGTQGLMHLASGMKRVRAFVHGERGGSLMNGCGRPEQHGTPPALC